MAKLMSALEASSYQHPNLNGPFGVLRKETVQTMVERGLEYSSLAEHPLCMGGRSGPIWACVSRFMASRVIGPLTNRMTMKIKRVAKYPDLFITGVRIAEVEASRILVKYATCSVVQKALISENEDWIVFFDHKRGGKPSLIEEGGEYGDMYVALKKRAAESSHTLKTWEEKQNAGNKGAKL
ncbi:hypothetical protein BGW36DRAFT_437919 [Talaromyces proteolyticus]|uniref:Uncharacterized protein n=1 Tax=Talaromyces proteolyticus TaxID=1131652 RepID=A0AAD4KNM2_9EURO|nr:uncharacterized protein BGW36DRAFT_437919 [Talaromyces proteolyticus]KAH8692075.1 hypothetical protein BGW36DRAFT_437919 [Talaromyces proteolyticus]